MNNCLTHNVTIARLNVISILVTNNDFIFLQQSWMLYSKGIFKLVKLLDIQARKKTKSKFIKKKI